jgi:hypothetical protein
MKRSTRLLRKGALIAETRAVLRLWNPEQGVTENLQTSLAENAVGARSAAWLGEIKSTLCSRLSELSAAELESLAALARSRAEDDVWRACLHYHSGRADLIYYRFATDWLFEHFRRGTYRIRTGDVVPFVAASFRTASGAGHDLSEYGQVRAARDLLRMATDFGILQGTAWKEFTQLHLSDESLVYLLHTMAQSEPNARRVVESQSWRMFLMSPLDVEREILRLHQFKSLHYEVAGSLAQLTLPFASATEYVQELLS